MAEEMHPLVQEKVEETRISTDAVFFTLSNERRRHVLRYLREQGETVPFRDLVRVVAARERNVPEGELTYDQRKSVYVSLRQTHLPKMDTLGIVHYDADAGTIELADGISDFDFYYEPVAGNEIAWGEFYLGLTALLGGIVAMATLDLVPVRLPVGLLPWLVLTGFGIAAVVHTYQTRRHRLDLTIPWSESDRSDDGPRRRNGG
jgi:hypothetical protein